jgi:hypothetical protein
MLKNFGKIITSSTQHPSGGGGGGRSYDLVSLENLAVQTQTADGFMSSAVFHIYEMEIKICRLH